MRLSSASASIWSTITLRICAVVTMLAVSAAYVMTLIWVRGGRLARMAVSKVTSPTGSCWWIIR